MRAAAFPLFFLPSLSVAFNECETPTLENGWVEAAPGSGPDSFVGRFQCRDGFLLSGESRVKCRSGVWSQATLPVCTALMACPEQHLPTIENGYRRGVAKLQNSVYRWINLGSINMKIDGYQVQMLLWLPTFGSSVRPLQWSQLGDNRAPNLCKCVFLTQKVTSRPQKMSFPI